MKIMGRLFNPSHIVRKVARYQKVENFYPPMVSSFTNEIYFSTNLFFLKPQWEKIKRIFQ